MYNRNELLTKTNIMDFVRTEDFVNGEQYDTNKIKLANTNRMQSYDSTIYVYHFQIDSMDKNTYFDTYIYMKNNKEILKTSCDCSKFRSSYSCPHIACALINYADKLFSESHLTHDISDNILDLFVEEPSNIVKKELNVEFILNVEQYQSYYYYYGETKRLNIKILLGSDKLYTLGNHASAFQRCYKYKVGEVYFGKQFTYKPDEYYVTDETDKMLNAYFDLLDSSSYGNYSESNVKKFFNVLTNSKFTINNYYIDGIKTNFPINSNLIKDNDNYKLEFDLNSLDTIIANDYEYILYKGDMYHLNQKEQKLLETLMDNNMNELTIKNDKFNTFTKGLLSIVRKNLNIDTSVQNITLPKDINSSLYFDLRGNYILCNVVFKYDNKDVNYFDNSIDVLRDTNFESMVINDLLKYGFIVNDKKIILDELEKQVDFMESGLEELASKYEVFTTEKFKKVSIKKKTSVSSMFGIGQDNILSYNFDLGDIKSDELVNIFKGIKNKKRYYRLKNGDILNLEDESLQELENLSEDLELTDEEIINGKGTILKYRAIYLDSLKNTKYNIINTDNLFDKFINNFYEYKDSKLTLSKKDLSILRPYQEVGVKWLYNLSKTGFGGILADEMGLGKTIQVVYYIKQALIDEADAKFLVVVPTSLAYNWDHEFSMYGNNIKRVILNKDKSNRVRVLRNLNNINVVVTTYGILREDEELYENLSFNTMIIDEAQNIKNNMAGITKTVKRIKADTKFALTGTPIENNVLELWSIFDYIMPGYLSNLTRFQGKYKIKDFNEESDALIKGLSKEINPFILRRKKKDVVKELPEKLINDIYIDLETNQKKLYAAELEKVKAEMEKIMEDGGMSKARFLILQLLTKLRQICIDPSIVYEDYNSESNKIIELTNIVKEYISNNHKILIFSSFRTALNIVKDKLKESDIDTFMIDGSVPSKKRQEMVDKFNESDDVKVFLIMLKSGGTGLNLAAADTVIHLDLWWNPQAENQATDRAHRIGQTKTVEVIHLIMKGTIEEKILELQNKKRLLSDKLIDGEARDKNILSELTKEDIANLLSYENKD